MHRRLIVAAVAAAALAACAGKQAVPPTPAHSIAAPAPTPAAPVAAPGPGPATGLELLIEPATASIVIDGEKRGTVAQLTSGILGLAPGIYQVSLGAPGYVTWRAEVAVRTGRERIEVKLAPKGAGER